MAGTYHEGSRRLQDSFDTRRLADRLDERFVQRRTIDARGKAFIERQDMFFLPGIRRGIDQTDLRLAASFSTELFASPKSMAVFWL